MADPPKKNRKRSHKIRINCFSFKACFGSSHKEIIKSSDGGKGIKRSSQITNTIPIIHSKFAASSYTADSSKKVDVVKMIEKNTDHLATPQVNMITNKESSQAKVKTPRKLLHSVSLPAPAPAPALSRQDIKKSWSSEGGDKRGKINIGDHNELDSIVGALVIMVTLIVMLVWGKVCAIICTAMWFNFIPRFRASNGFSIMKLNNNNNNNNNKNDLHDFDSSEYKKRVVLEGLLKRNHN